jgi:hypothetical protein
MPDGRWMGDKWNGSWLYTTSQVLGVLQGTIYHEALRPAADAILAEQLPDGSWGARGPTVEETAYAVLALRMLLRKGEANGAEQEALARAEGWMLKQYRPFGADPFTCWLGKEMYRPLRLARLVELVATLPSDIAQRGQIETSYLEPILV